VGAAITEDILLLLIIRRDVLFIELIIGVVVHVVGLVLSIDVGFELELVTIADTLMSELVVVGLTVAIVLVLAEVQVEVDFVDETRWSSELKFIDGAPSVIICNVLPPVLMLCQLPLMSL